MELVTLCRRQFLQLCGCKAAEPVLDAADAVRGLAGRGERFLQGYQVNCSEQLQT